MARRGVDYETVKHAAFKLLSQGVAPSVLKIRELLGTGSHTTIAEHLKYWREEQSQKTVHHLPANIPKELIATFDVLWQTALEHAAQQLADVKHDLQQKEEKLRQDQLLTEKNIADLNDQLAETKRQRQMEQEENQSLQTQLAVMHERFGNQSDELLTLKNQYEKRLNHTNLEKHEALEKAEKLQAEITRLQKQLSAQTEKHQQQLTKERELQEQSETRWLNLIDQARQETKQLRKNYEHLLSQKSKELASFQDLTTQLQQEKTAWQSTLEYKENTVQELKAALNKTQQELSKAHSTIAVLESKLENSGKRKINKKQNVTSVTA